MSMGSHFDLQRYLPASIAILVVAFLLVVGAISMASAANGTDTGADTETTSTLASRDVTGTDLQSEIADDGNQGAHDDDDLAELGDDDRGVHDDDDLAELGDDDRGVHDDDDQGVHDDDDQGVHDDDDQGDHDDDDQGDHDDDQGDHGDDQGDHGGNHQHGHED